MADLTNAMSEYVRITKEIKQLETKQKEFRKEAIEEFTMNPDVSFDGLSMSSYDQIKFIQTELFNWVKENFPEHLEACRKDEIDEEKLETLIAQRKILFDDMPRELYTITPIVKLNLPRGKK